MKMNIKAMNKFDDISLLLTVFAPNHYPQKR